MTFAANATRFGVLIRAGSSTRRKIEKDARIHNKMPVMIMPAHYSDSNDVQDVLNQTHFNLVFPICI